jgi:hypothetical protein
MVTDAATARARATARAPYRARAHATREARPELAGARPRREAQAAGRPRHGHEHAGRRGRRHPVTAEDQHGGGSPDAGPTGSWLSVTRPINTAIASKIEASTPTSRSSQWRAICAITRDEHEGDHEPAAAQAAQHRQPVPQVTPLAQREMAQAGADRRDQRDGHERQPPRQVQRPDERERRQRGEREPTASRSTAQPRTRGGARRRSPAKSAPKRRRAPADGDAPPRTSARTPRPARTTATGANESPRRAIAGHRVCMNVMVPIALETIVRSVGFLYSGAYVGSSGRPCRWT